jgi:hypothetical protein
MGIGAYGSGWTGSLIKKGRDGLAGATPSREAVDDDDGVLLVYDLLKFIIPAIARVLLAADRDASLEIDVGKLGAYILSCEDAERRLTT